MKWNCPKCKTSHLDKTYNCKCGYERCDPTICHSKCIRGCPCGYCRINRMEHERSLKMIKKIDPRQQHLRKEKVTLYGKKIDAYIIVWNRH